jgi:hypothetical protein
MALNRSITDHLLGLLRNNLSKGSSCKLDFLPSIDSAINIYRQRAPLTHFPNLLA